MRDTAERNRLIYERRKGGETFASLAREYGVGTERVRQIYERQCRIDGKIFEGAEVSEDIVDVFKSVPVEDRDALYVRAWHCVKNTQQFGGKATRQDVVNWLQSYESTRTPNLGRKAHALLCKMFGIEKQW